MSELPRYRSHKIVSALKISTVGPDPLSEAVSEAARVLTFVEPGYPPMRVGEGYVRKHDPKPGGYWVRYDDGYESWSPAEAFEAGYTRI